MSQRAQIRDSLSKSEEDEFKREEWPFTHKPSCHLVSEVQMDLRRV